MQEFIKLDLADLVSATAFIVIAIGLSAWEKIGLEFNLALAAGRTILQLAVLGYALDLIFAFDNPVAVLVFLAVLLTIAALVARNRITQKIPQVLPLVWSAMLVSTAVTAVYTNLVILQPHHWYQAQYIIPLATVVLGNATNAAAIAGEHLVSTVNANRLEIETHLSLGATPDVAIAQYRQQAIRAGLIPTLHQMTTIGMISLPQFVAGQLLSGINPLDAISYQILLLFMIAFTNFLTVILLTKGLGRQFFNSAAQLIR